MTRAVMLLPPSGTRRFLRSRDVKRLVCLLSLGIALVSAPVLGAVSGVPPTVAAVSPPLSSVSNGGGCTPVNPCAVVTPALGNAPLPAPEMPAQPDLSAATQTSATAPAAQAPRAASSDCPPAGGQRRAQFAGRGGNGPGAGGRGGAEGFRRFAQAGARNGNGEGGRGAGNGQGRGQPARGADGCPRPPASGGTR
jgi:hypothetical protein